MKKPAAEELVQVCERLMPCNGPRHETPIPSDTIRLWMKSPSLDVQAVVYDFVMDPENAMRITPPLTFNDYRYFVPNYLFRCLAEDPVSEWAATRFQAGNELLNWFGIIWDDLSIEKEALHEAETLLRTLCLDHGPEVRRVVIQEVLEHLFENRSVRAFFAQWKEDPVLHDVYEEADEWQRLGGRSPLSPKGSR
jgi:hypothetical protein